MHAVYLMDFQHSFIYCITFLIYLQSKCLRTKDYTQYFFFCMSNYCNWYFCVYFVGKQNDGKCTLEATQQVIDIKNQSLSRAGKLHTYHKRDHERDIGTLEKKGKHIQPVISLKS